MRWNFVVALLALALSGCLGGSPDARTASNDATLGWSLLGGPATDPLADGPFAWTTQDYALGNTTVGGPDAEHDEYEYEALIRGAITIPDGAGPFPLAVFLHGQHSTCSGPDGREGSDCSKPYRNDLGYLYLMEHLASHGIATASILGFEVNQKNGSPDVGMWARGELVLATIDALLNSSHASHLDFTRIGLMGHSRGGEGVVTATEVNALRPAPHALAAVIALAPTDFALRSVKSIPFLTLAPYCDGDVYSLHGLRQFDQSRFEDNGTVKVQLLVMGANHNNYNTNWGRGPETLLTYDGDDGFVGRHQNTHCDLHRENGGGRLTLEETYAQGILHMGGFLRWTLLDDASFAPFFLGAEQPAEACPMQRSCPGAVHISTRTPGARDLFWAEETGTVGADGVTVTDAPVCQMKGCAENVYSSAWMADIGFIETSDPFVIAFDAPTDLRETPILNVRVGIPTDKSVNAFGPPAMQVTFRTATGEETLDVRHPALFLPPGLVVDPGVSLIGFAYLGGAKVAANAVSIPIPGAVDAANVTAIEIIVTGTGPDRVLLADAWLNRETSAARAPQDPA